MTLGWHIVPTVGARSRRTRPLPVRNTHSRLVGEVDKLLAVSTGHPLATAPRELSDTPRDA